MKTLISRVRWGCWCLAVVGALRTAQAAELTVVGYNVESGGAVPEVVAQRVAKQDGVDVWGFCEVESAAAPTFEHAAEDGENANFEHVLGTTGGADRLLIVYDADRFELVGKRELHEMNLGGNVRAPLAATLRDKPSGQSFLFMVNHLYRSKPQERHKQAEMLNHWAKTQGLPVIAVGDYNFDWDVQGGEQHHDAGFDKLTADGTFVWVKPATLVKTQSSDRFDSVLDFVFVSGVAKTWTGSATIEVEPGDFPDDEATSDHRPMRAKFTMSADDVTPSPRAKLLEHVKKLEAELAALRREVERLPN